MLCGSCNPAPCCLTVSRCSADVTHGITLPSRDTGSGHTIDLVAKQYALCLTEGWNRICGEHHVVLLFILLTHSDHLCQHRPDTRHGQVGGDHLHLFFSIFPSYSTSTFDSSFSAVSTMGVALSKFGILSISN